MTESEETGAPAPGPMPDASGSAALVRRPPAQMQPYRGGIFGRLLSPLFNKVRVEDEVRERLIKSHNRGLVVHVMRSRRVLDPTFILYLLNQLQLPAPRWMHDHYAGRLPPTESTLREVILGGEPALLFLRRPRTLISRGQYAEQYVEALIDLQRKTDVPILLLPEALLWTKQPVGLRRTIFDSIFGNREAPGRLRELLGFLWQRDGARFHVAEPVNIAAVLEREQGTPDRIIAKKIRWSILQHLAQEDRLRTGPYQRPIARTRQMVLNDPRVRRAIDDAVEDGHARLPLEQKASEMVKKIAADPRYGWLRVFDAIVDIVWKRIYDGIVVDEEGLARVRRAARKGPVVVVPSHKSHIDYLVLSQVFFKDGMMPPHIAAGENLDFWPIGFVFRRSGAFYIRRSIRGDKLYTSVLNAYVRRVVKDGNAIEFFIEGGRSRTGKLLPPRMGMLGMCTEPVFDGSINDLSFIPVSINYEKLIEAGSYRRELDGEKKKKEDVGALLSSTSILRSKYGRVYVDFAEPISLRVFLAARGHSPDIGPKDKRAVIHQLGHRIVYGINEATRVTATSIAGLVLLATRQSGLGEQDFFRGADLALDFLDGLGIRCSAALDAKTRPDALRASLTTLQADDFVERVIAPGGEPLYRISADGRKALDYYKNNVLHFFVPFSVLAAATLIEAGEETPDVKNRARRLSHLLKLEFSFRVDQDFETNVEEATRYLTKRRILKVDDARTQFTVAPGGRQEALLLGGLIASFLEGYRIAAEVLAVATDEPLLERQFADLCLMNAERQTLEGRLRRAEASSRPLFLSAAELMIEDGIVEKKRRRFAVVDEKGRREFVNELKRYLRALLISPDR